MATIEEALAELRAGRIVVLRENEGPAGAGQLVVAAEAVTPATVNFMAREGRGLVCLALTPERCDQLGLELIPSRGAPASSKAFTVSIEAREGVTTGISAADRARSIAVAVDPCSGAEDVCSPGHVFPLRARPGGLLERAGEAEAAVELARLAGLAPAAALCEILAENGRELRGTELLGYCDLHGLKTISIPALLAHRHPREPLVERLAEVAPITTDFGVFEAVAYRSLRDGACHVALRKGEVAGHEDVLVRVHRECLAGDVFDSMRCRCASSLEQALAAIYAEGEGVLVYLAQADRGIGALAGAVGSPSAEAAESDAGFPVDWPEYTVAGQILADLGLRSLRLLTDTREGVHGLERYGLSVSAMLSLEMARLDPRAEAYMRV